ncbi:glycosyltransferase family 2 protein [Succinivibrio sp.]|uniref:glycosyltransferase family 2 protein n=1 Tax=Succinivibrio sp. TaxID=2053619 RepID=UPI00386C9028
MNQPLISVIVPCFNVEKQIDRCLKSLTEQTLDKSFYEIIAINDASEDKTFDKLVEWEKKFPSLISVITYDENQRQGGARNQGIAIAKGEYLAFVDSDDFVNIHLYQEVKNIIDKHRYDEILIKGTNVNHIKSEDISFIEKSMKTLEHSKTRQDLAVEHKRIENFFDYHLPSYGNNGNLFFTSHIFKRALFTDNDIAFPVKCAYEDNYLTKVISLYIKDTYLIDEIFYFYCENLSSTVNSNNASHHLDRLDIELAVLEYYKLVGAFSLFKKELEWPFIEFFYLNTLYILFTKFDKLPDIYNFMRDEVYKNFPDFAKNENFNKVSKRQKLLLELLKSKVDVTPEELQKIQIAYLKSIINSK